MHCARTDGILYGRVPWSDTRNLEILGGRAVYAPGGERECGRKRGGSGQAARCGQADKGDGGEC